MSGFIKGVNRDQTTLFPQQLEDWICEDHLFRVVDLFVDERDLPPWVFIVMQPLGWDGRAIIRRCCSNCSSTAM